MHAPECDAVCAEQDSLPDNECLICRAVRAREQRVLGAIDLTAANVQYHRVGFKEGLNAAREAVAALNVGRDVRFSVDVQADALAAIDKLREKR